MLSSWGRFPFSEEPAAVALLLVLCAVAAVLDLTTRRIPNYLTYTAGALGLSLCIEGGRFGFGAAGLFIGVAVLYPAFRSRKLGGGDVKLMGAIGAIGGFPFVVEALLYGFAIGGGMAVWTVVRSGRLGEAVSRVSSELGAAAGFGLGSSSTIDSDDQLDRIPLGVGLSAGAVLAVFDRQYGLLRWVDPLYHFVHRVTS